VRDPQRTPFNIGQRVEMTDFSFDEALPLAAGLGLPEIEARQALQWVLDWTNGHPYLTQRLCQAITERSTPPSDGRTPPLTSQWARGYTNMRVNAVDPGYTATDFNNHTGHNTVEEGAEIIVRLAQIGPDGPTGTYQDRHGVVPW